MQHNHLRWAVNTGLILVLLAGVVYAFWPFIEAKRHVQEFCESLAVGAALPDVKARAAAQGYVVSAQADGSVLVDDEASWGRRTCIVHFGAAGLVSSRFSDGE